MKPIKINSLQVYRGLAAILVVLYHITDQSPTKFGFTFLGNLFSFGFIGVDFFFVLSGFIILYVHNKDIGHQTRFRGYITKRFIRLYPIYWGIALVKILSIYLIPSIAKSYETGLWYTVKSVILLPQVNLPIIGVAWSLSYEVLFYLLFGIAIVIGSRWAYSLLLVWSALIISVLSLKFINMPVFESSFIFNFILNERNLEFIFGCIAAYILIHGEMKYRRIIAIVGGLLFIFWSLYIYQGNQVFSYALTIGIASFLLILGSAAAEINRFINWPKILIFFGDASYSIYLTHVMFINTMMIIFLRLRLSSVFGSLWSSLILLAFAVLGGSLVYVFLEKPMIVFLRKRLL